MNNLGWGEIRTTLARKLLRTAICIGVLRFLRYLVSTAYVYYYNIYKIAKFCSRYYKHSCSNIIEIYEISRKSF